MSTTKSYRTNLRCESCVATLRPHLDAEPTIESWEADVKSPDKILTVHGSRVSDEVVDAVVSKAGYKILGQTSPTAAQVSNGGKDSGSHHKLHDVLPALPDVSDEPKVTYYPLFLVFGYITMVAAAVEIAAGSFSLNRAMGNFMGGFFIAFSFFKLLDLRGFADSYRMYDVVAKSWPGYGFVYPFVELGLGAAYITGVQPFATNLATVVVMGVSSVGVIQSLVNKQKIRCACLGTVFNLPMSTVTLIEDGLMVAMAAAMLLIPAAH